jgi:hypothetical protein
MQTRILFGMILLVIGHWGGAQTSGQHLFSGSVKPGFYVSPSLQYGPVAGAGAAFATAQGGLVFNKRWAMGGMYSFSVNEFTPSVEVLRDTYLDLWMGAFFLEYTWRPDRLVHLTFPLYVGGGELELDWKESSPFYSQDPDFGEDYFFFIQPGAMLELNLASFMRLYGGAVYRWAPGGVDYRGLDAADISGLAGVLGLKFGLFR